MSRLFYHVMQDNAGNLLFDVSGTMRIAGTGTVATIYGDAALTIPIANPMTNHPSFGSFKCYLGAGSYDFSMAKAGYTFETLTGLQGWGTMALQNADNVAITGGSVQNLTGPTALTAFGTLTVDETNKRVTAVGMLIVGAIIGPQGKIEVVWDKTLQHAMVLKPGGDAGAFATLNFLNAAGVQVGSISQTGAATAYNTTSDARLKDNVDDLTGELALITALRPVRFVWKADGEPGVGFLASEVAALVQGVITGEEGAVNSDGTIVPQMIDYSKLVPFLVGAVKTLTARIAVLEDALGV